MEAPPPCWPPLLIAVYVVEIQFSLLLIVLLGILIKTWKKNSLYILTLLSVIFALSFKILRFFENYYAHYNPVLVGIITYPQIFSINFHYIFYLEFQLRMALVPYVSKTWYTRLTQIIHYLIIAFDPFLIGMIGYRFTVTQNAAEIGPLLLLFFMLIVFDNLLSTIIFTIPVLRTLGELGSFKARSKSDSRLRMAIVVKWILCVVSLIAVLVEAFALSFIPNLDEASLFEAVTMTLTCVTTTYVAVKGLKVGFGYSGPGSTTTTTTTTSNPNTTTTITSSQLPSTNQYTTSSDLHSKGC